METSEYFLTLNFPSTSWFFYSRGFAYLIYFNEKSALECLDLMGYYFIKQKPGVMLDVERSQERSHLLVLNIPDIADAHIEAGLRNLYKQVSKVTIVRGSIASEDASIRAGCSAIIEFPNHKSALNAKRWSGIGSVNVWSRNIKVLWATVEQVEQLLSPSEEVKHVLVHNVPEDLDPEEFGASCQNYVKPHEIVSIRPMNNDWMIEFTKTHAAYKIFSVFNGMQIGNREIFTEWVTHERMKMIDNFADFDFELRCLCLANYFDPPIFIYGRVIPFTKTQVVETLIEFNGLNI